MAEILKFPHSNIHVAITLYKKARALQDKDSNSEAAVQLFREANRYFFIHTRSSRLHINSLWQANEVLFAKLRNQEGIECWTKVKFYKDNKEVKSESKIYRIYQSFKKWCKKALQRRATGLFC